MLNDSEKKFYQKGCFIGVMLFLFFSVGLFLLSFYVKSDDLFKILLTALFMNIFALMLNIYLDNRRNKTTVYNKKQVLLKSIRAELETLVYLIESRCKDLPAGFKQNPALCEFIYFHIGHNYFTIFDTTAKTFGILDNEALTSDLIKTYMETKGFFDSLIELENSTKWIVNIALSNPPNPQLSKLSEANSIFSTKIIDSLPCVLQNLKNRINEINNELHKK